MTQAKGQRLKTVSGMPRIAVMEMGSVLAQLPLLRVMQKRPLNGVV